MLNMIRNSARCMGLAISVAAISSATSWADGHIEITTLKPGILQACLYPGFPPFAYKENGAWKGWDVDYLAAFAGKNGLKLEVVEVPQFEGIWLTPGTSKCDIAGSGISDTAERRTAAGPESCWSNTYYNVVRSYLVRGQEREKLTKIEDLKGKTTIVTNGSTAHLDLCNRMQAVQMHACARPDGQDPCAHLKEMTREADPTCVNVEYLQDDDEAKAAAAIASGTGPESPFAYGAGYGSVQTLVDETPGLALTWPHCNMAIYEGKVEPYAEPFSFVLSSKDNGLFKALNEFIGDSSAPYAGTAVPDLGCKAPAWTLAPQANPACQP